MGTERKSARWIFRAAGAYGLLTLPPQYFMEARIGGDYPPVITHPEYFYGFLGVGIAWQIAFFLIARDPVRLRPIIPAAIVEKVSFGVAAWGLFAWGRVPGLLAGFGTVDLVLAALFTWAFLTVPDPFSRVSRPSVPSVAGWR